MPYLDHDVIGSTITHEIVRVSTVIDKIVTVADTRTRGAKEPTQTPAYQDFQGRRVAGIDQSVIGIVVHFSTGKFVVAAIASISPTILILSAGQSIRENVRYFVMGEVAHANSYQGDFWRVEEFVVHFVDSSSFFIVDNIVVGVDCSMMSGCGQFGRQREVLGLGQSGFCFLVRAITWR